VRPPKLPSASADRRKGSGGTGRFPQLVLGVVRSRPKPRPSPGTRRLEFPALVLESKKDRCPFLLAWLGRDLDVHQ
jgi:hypothetical protein